MITNNSCKNYNRNSNYLLTETGNPQFHFDCVRQGMCASTIWCRKAAMTNKMIWLAARLIIFYCTGNSKLLIYNQGFRDKSLINPWYNTQPESDWLFNTQSRELQADWLIFENNEKATLNIHMTYWPEVVIQWTQRAFIFLNTPSLTAAEVYIPAGRDASIVLITLMTSSTCASAVHIEVAILTSIPESIIKYVRK